MDIGGSTADGVVDGLVDGVVQRQGDIDGAADFITARFKDRLQIQSPSKVFREIGQFLTEGLALGISDNAPKAEAALGDTAGKMTKSMEKLGDLGKQASSAIRGAFDGLFDDPARALRDLAKQLAQMALYRGLANAFPSAFGAGGAVPLVANARGNVFNRGAVQAFAAGGIVSRATAFGMAGGRMGVMGEAGPEAILPLTRIGGKLGVAAQGGGGSIVQVNVINNTGAPVERRESRGRDGKRQVDLIIGESVASGRQDGALRARFGVPPSPIKR
jgi:phage-related minor tail protein